MNEKLNRLINKGIVCLDKLEDAIENDELTYEDKLSLLRFLTSKPWCIQEIITIIESIDDIEKKGNAIKLIRSQNLKIELIKKLPNKEKIKLIDCINIFFQKKVILDSIEEEIRIEYIESDEFNEIKEVNKSLIISSISDDTTKLIYLKHIKNELNKAMIICTLDDDIKKLKLIENIKNKRARAIIYCSLRNKENFNFIPYVDQKYRNIGLPKKMTIGLEIESEGKAYQHLFQMENILNKWKSKIDISLEGGVEIVSDVLTDNPQNVNEIYILNNLLNQAGQKTTFDCGAHIHIGANYLTNVQSYINLLEIYCNCEKIFYLISNREDDIVDKDRLEEYCSPISEKLSKAIEKGVFSKNRTKTIEIFIRMLKAVQSTRTKGINFQNVGNKRKNTIEFRLPNGILDPDTWIENIRLFGRLIQVSEDLTHEDCKDIEKKLLLKNQLKDENLKDDEKLEVLLELLFTPEERIIYKKRYIANKEKIDSLDEYDKPFRDDFFANVNFGRDDFKEVAENVPMGEVEEVRRQTAKLIEERFPMKGDGQITND